MNSISRKMGKQRSLLFSALVIAVGMLLFPVQARSVEPQEREEVVLVSPKSLARLDSSPKKADLVEVERLAAEGLSKKDIAEAIDLFNREGF